MPPKQRLVFKKGFLRPKQATPEETAKAVAIAAAAATKKAVDDAKEAAALVSNPVALLARLRSQERQIALLRAALENITPLTMG
jgi:hypothetical protein